MDTTPRRPIQAPEAPKAPETSKSPETSKAPEASEVALSRDELREKLHKKIQSKKGVRSKHATPKMDKILANNPTGVDLSFAKTLMEKLDKDDLRSVIQIAAGKASSTSGLSSRKARKQIEKMLEK